MRAKLLLICVALLVLAVVLVKRDYYILLAGERVDGIADVEVYELDDARRLVLGEDVRLLINVDERGVLAMSSNERRIWFVVLWPRDAKGVVLGDGTKGNEDDSYRFGPDGVDIRYAAATCTYNLHVDL